MIFVTGRRLTLGGSRPSHITHLRWRDAGSNGAETISTRSWMVDFVDRGGLAKVHNNYGADPQVRSVHPANADPYVQTKPDNTTSDNLLSLPPC